MAVVLQPAGNPSAYEHYNDTIENPVNISDSEIRDLLGSDLEKLEKIFDGHDVPMWGIVPGKVNSGKFNRMAVGDRVLFARKKLIFASGTVAYKFENYDLSVSLWEFDNEGRTWSHMYALSDIKEERIPYLEFNRTVGYSDKNNIQKFDVLSVDKSNRVEAKFFLGKAHIQPDVSKKEYNRFLVEEVDVETKGTRRVEQPYLRNLLFGGKEVCGCSICGHEFPVQLLVAAHIKQRARCTIDEKLDDNIVMSACVFGCDSLYERGWIGIDDGGVIRKGSISSTVAPVVSSYIDSIEGELCRAHGPSTSAYFAWHWKNKVVKS
tara:strand:- start:347 stop:1309 length:963 start_codon:yes stop_codon:yes gene_type:complete